MNEDDRETLRLTPAEVEWLEAKLAEEPKVLPGLKRLLEEEFYFDA